jgi:hypothetical protein
MNDNERYRKKTLAGLAALFKNEEAELRKFRRTSSVLQYLGAFALVVSVWIAWDTGEWPLALLALFAAAGGLMMGLSLLFDVSWRQWPIIKPLLDRATIERDADGPRQSGGP